jgi:hypothetical protein
MPPTREQIRPQVIHTLSIVSGFPETAIADGPQSLADDLGLTEDLRGALARSFQRIAQMFAPGAKVTKTECKQLKTVKTAIDLVLTRAGGVA